MTCRQSRFPKRLNHIWSLSSVKIFETLKTFDLSIWSRFPKRFKTCWLVVSHDFWNNLKRLTCRQSRFPRNAPKHLTCRQSLISETLTNIWLVEKSRFPKRLTHCGYKCRQGSNIFETLKDRSALKIGLVTEFRKRNKSLKHVDLSSVTISGTTKKRLTESSLTISEDRCVVNIWLVVKSLRFPKRKLKHLFLSSVTISETTKTTFDSVSPMEVRKTPFETLTHTVWLVVKRKRFPETLKWHVDLSSSPEGSGTNPKIVVYWRSGLGSRFREKKRKLKTCWLVVLGHDFRNNKKTFDLSSVTISQQRLKHLNLPSVTISDTLKTFESEQSRTMSEHA